MPTPGEQKALLFLGAVALLGGAVRLLGSAPPVQVPSEAEQRGLILQMAATESAAAAKRLGKASKKPRKKKGQADSASVGTSQATAYGRPPTRLDVDRATEAELDALPGVGPALAARIVNDRIANGPFGSLQALDGVSGVGPTLIRKLEPHVTFSGPPRPSTAAGSGDGARASGGVVGLIGWRP